MVAAIARASPHPAIRVGGRDIVVARSLSEGRIEADRGLHSAGVAATGTPTASIAARGVASPPTRGEKRVGVGRGSHVVVVLWDLRQPFPYPIGDGHRGVHRDVIDVPCRLNGLEN